MEQMDGMMIGMMMKLSATTVGETRSQQSHHYQGEEPIQEWLEQGQFERVWTGNEKPLYNGIISFFY